jgi:hypothetical protein
MIPTMINPPNSSVTSKWKLTSRGPWHDRPWFAGGDALWSVQCNNKLEKRVINTRGVSRSATSPMA